MKELTQFHNMNILIDLKDHDGLITLSLLSVLLDKQKHHVIKKAQKLADADELQFAKKENCKVPTGNGGFKESIEYFVTPEDAVALAMTYSLRLGKAVLKALKEAQAGLVKVTQSVDHAEAVRVAMAALSDSKAALCAYTENPKDEPSVAMNILKRLK